MTTLVIDAMERRDVAVFDVPGAYLQTPMPKDKNILMVIRGQFVDILCDVNPKYREHVRMINGKKVLYVKVLRAIYGCIESAMLWYNLYSSTLKQMGFILNPYDRCTANKLINGTQCTIIFYVDDNKISHKEPDVVTEVLNQIRSHFGELVISRGTKHDFLGININLRKDGLVEVEQRKQIEEVLTHFGPFETHKFNSPCANHL